ncbi:MAG: phenylalanine--tRNA ligase subunit beta [Ignavibacteriales bacterium]
MKLSLNWIKDYVKIPESLDIAKLEYDLTMSTVEVEGVTRLAQKFENIIIGIIKEILPHPNADKLKICKTDIGQSDIKEIVCGGTNVKVGMKVAVACPGAMVRWHGKGELAEIKQTKVRDAESFGMICASSEIGLFDLFPFAEEGTILDLSQFDAQAGTNLAEALGLDDIILEIDNKSLTNRPDLWGHYGIAREISALYNLPFKEFVPFSPPTVQNLIINLEDEVCCPRYIGVKIENVSVKLSPFEVQSRIWRVGMRPINAIVDITNYVMLSTGQPLHAFDSDKINGNITVRRAENLEKMLLLDGKELSFSAEDLVIADENESIALAGIMGGKKDSVLPETNKIILEIANFEPIGIRRSTMRHEVRTESSTRNEKGIDPERCDIALSLAMEMFKKIFPSMLVTSFSDNYPKRLKKSEINVSLDWLEKCLGKRIRNEDIEKKLKKLGIEVTFNGDIMHVVVPTWRSTGDISEPHDIMEEVARTHGFDNFEPMPIITSFEGAINQPKVDIDRRIREYLAFRCGMNEVFTYPWVSDEYLNALSLNTDEMISLSAPPSSSERYIRSSLLPNICKSVSENLRFFDKFGIFESAKVFFNKDFKALNDSREFLPLERKNVAGAYVDNPKNINVLFRKIKGVVQALPRYIHTEPIIFERVEKPSWADNVIWLNITHNGEKVGNLGLLSKKASLDCGIKNSAVMLFELDIDLLKPYASRTNKFTRIPEYPMTGYDVSMLFNSAVKWEQIFETVICKSEYDSENLLQDVFFVDEYKGQQVPEGKKSVTFRLIIGSLKKTLTSNEIESCANTIIRRLEKTLDAELRG